MASLKALDNPDSYTIAWIAALPIERAAAEAMLDEEHAPPNGFSRHETDPNVYTWGRVGEHNIVIVSLPAGAYGTTSAATTASSLLASLPAIRIGLLVGIGGGIARPDEDYDIRLGDVVVSQPNGTTGGVYQYDLIKAKPGDKRKVMGFLGRPPTVLLNALARIQSDHERKDSKVPQLVREMLEKNPKMGKQSKKSPGYVYQGGPSDRLFEASYEHGLGPDCSGCDGAGEVQRDSRDTTDPEIHYGVIASGNTRMSSPSCLIYPLSPSAVSGAVGISFAPELLPTQPTQGNRLPIADILGQLSKTPIHAIGFWLTLGRTASALRWRRPA